MSMSEPLWTSQDAASATGGNTGGAWFADGVAVDSRDVIMGDLFVARMGSHADGHDHVAQALANGATGAMVSRPPKGVDGDDPRLLHVIDTQAALTALADTARARSDARVIAITGSAGKTGVKEALRQALARVGAVHASMRSFNNHVGVPLSLARMPRKTDFGVFEIGTGGPGEIGPLTQSVRPDLAILTTVGEAHIGEFPDADALAAEKSAIFSGLQSGGAAIVGLDHPHAETCLDAARRHAGRVLTVSLEREDADIRPLSLRPRPGGRHDLAIRTPRGRLDLSLAAPGRHWAYSSLLVLAALEALAVDMGNAALALAGMQPLPGRGRQFLLSPDSGAPVRLIDDSYNANPLSMAAAFDSMAELAPQPGRRLAVVADMAELGDDTQSRARHLALAPRLRAAGLDMVICIGEHSRAMADAAAIPAITCENAKAAERALIDALMPGDAVLVKGANRAQLGGLVAALRRRFPLAEAPAILAATG